jgi:hypothetical protein
VPTAVVLTAGTNVVLVLPADETPRVFPRSPDRARRARAATEVRAADLPPGLVDAIGKLSDRDRVTAVGTGLRSALSAATRRPVGAPTPAEAHAARARALWPEGEAERAYLRAVASDALESGLRSPVEVLITLAREEERVERALEREARAYESFPVLSGTPLAEYAEEWTRRKSQWTEHHRGLEDRVALEARRTVPNLSAVVGPKVAARLVAAAGGVVALGRMRASRLQLLGSRRRPSPDRGPRYGVLYRAERMSDVPGDRRAAFARSLAALAVIAARADAFTRSAVHPALVARRDRRISELARRRR